MQIPSAPLMYLLCFAKRITTLLVKVMQNVIAIAERHGLLVVFLNALLSQGGLPLPLVPTLMTVAALARQSPYQITQIILAGVSGALIAEAALYWCGLHYGQRFLALLCKLSFSPDFCVRRTEQVFARVGSWSLLFAKFIPGFSTHYGGDGWRHQDARARLPLA